MIKHDKSFELPRKWTWIKPSVSNKDRMLMSPKTRKSLEERLQMLVYKINELEGANTSEDGE